MHPFPLHRISQSDPCSIVQTLASSTSSMFASDSSSTAACSRRSSNACVVCSFLLAAKAGREKRKRKRCGCRPPFAPPVSSTYGSADNTARGPRKPHELRPSATKLLQSVRGYTLSGQRKRWETELVERVFNHRMPRYSSALAFRCCLCC